MGSCYCGNLGSAYEDCCKPFIDGVAIPATAEQLMRSRYTAYVLSDVVYILNTTHPSKRGEYNAKYIKDWATSSIWEKLEVISTKQGLLGDLIGHVEFKAYYSEKNYTKHIHHEYSTFEKLADVWYFVEGRVC